MFITKELALKIENCINNSHVQFTSQCTNGSVLKVGTGAAFFSGDNSFFSQVIGWGFDTTEEQFSSEIQEIEAFYLKLKYRQIDIELCPFVGNVIFSELSKRGYQITELNNISVLDLSRVGFAAVPTQEDCSIRPIDALYLDEWAASVASGFEYDEAIAQFYRYAKAECVTPFGVFIHNKLVAGGTIAIHNGIADLGITSTLPAWRNRGLQKSLLSARIEYAIQAGASIATVTTAPGSISDLNIQKMGFQMAYTRIKLGRTF